MIKEDATGGGMVVGIGGMAVDGMGGMGFTDTGNIAGIALGMTPVNKKKKKKKKGNNPYEGENMDTSIIDMVEQDLNTVKTTVDALKTQNVPASVARHNKDLIVPKGSTVFKRGTAPPDESMARKIPTPQNSSIDNSKDSVITEDTNAIMPVAAPFYTPKFNLASGVGTSGMTMQNPFREPGLLKGPRKRAVLAAILGGL